MPEGQGHGGHGGHGVYEEPAPRRLPTDDVAANARASHDPLLLLFPSANVVDRSSGRGRPAGSSALRQIMFTFRVEALLEAPVDGMGPRRRRGPNRRRRCRPGGAQAISTSTEPVCATTGNCTGTPMSE